MGHELHQITVTGEAAASAPSVAKASYALITLGCPKNLVDSERMGGLLRADGYRMVADPEGADFVVINTCGFIAPAREESHATIREVIDLKQRGRLRGIIVAGCLVERDKEKLLEQYPQVDQVVGVFARDDILAAARRLDDGLVQQRTLFRPATTRLLDDKDRLRITPNHLAFLKTSEGCNRTCSFCYIPKMRGRFVSKPIEQVVAEAQQLAADGVRELVLIAQDTSYYGLDLYGRPRLADLLRELDQLEDLAWIRLMYLYPMYISDELIETIAAAQRVLPYLDIPLQHINDEVLHRMQRRVNRQKTEELLDRLRAGIPRLVLRTTMIAGFPGETETQFVELLDFVAKRKFERLGAFAYSEEEGTPAFQLDGAVPIEERHRRREALLAAQQENAFAWGDARLGQPLEVILDAPVPEAPGAFVGRSYADAPEVDGAVYVSGENLAVGQIVPCEVVARRGYDLIGAAVGP
jgi:ribosomal protein S12 methylthiotransferase